MASASSDLTIKIWETVKLFLQNFFGNSITF
jgi:hypothetical protein